MADDAHPRLVADALRQQPAHALHDVLLHAAVAVITVRRKRIRASMPGGAAEIRLEYHVAAIGEELRGAVVTRAEVVDRAAVHLRDEWCVRGVHARRQQHETVHAQPIGGDIGHRELAREVRFGRRVGGDPGIVEDPSQVAVARVVEVPARIAQVRRTFAHQPMRRRTAAGLQADVAAGEFRGDGGHRGLRIADSVRRGDGAAVARRQRLQGAWIDHHVIEVGLAARILVQGLQPVVCVQAQHAAKIPIESVAGIAGHQQAAIGTRRQQVQSLHRPQAQHFAQRCVGVQPIQRIVAALETCQRDDTALCIQCDVVDPARIFAQYGALAICVHTHDSPSNGRPAFALAGGDAFAQQHGGRLRQIELDHPPPLTAAQRHAHTAAAVNADNGQRTWRTQEQPAAIARPHDLFSLSAADQHVRVAVAGRQQPQRARILLLAQIGHRIAGWRKLGGHQRAVFEEGRARQAWCMRQGALCGLCGAQAFDGLRVQGVRRKQQGAQRQHATQGSKYCHCRVLVPAGSGRDRLRARCSHRQGFATRVQQPQTDQRRQPDHATQHDPADAATHRKLQPAR